MVPLRKGSIGNGLGVPGTVGIVHAVEVTAQEASEASARFFAGWSTVHHRCRFRGAGRRKLIGLVVVADGQRKSPVGWRSLRGAASIVRLVVVVNGRWR